MGNGSAERFNQTLLKMLTTLEDQTSDWKSYIAPLVQAYNATKNDATGYSPHYLMFGWNSRLSVDAFLFTEPRSEGAPDQNSYVKRLKKLNHQKRTRKDTRRCRNPSYKLEIQSW